MPNAVGPRVDFKATAMSLTQALHLEPGSYNAAAASSQKKGRSARSVSLKRQVSKKTEVSSDGIMQVYRALRVGERPDALRKVIPDTNDFTSCHGICSLCPLSAYLDFRRQASATYQHRVVPHLIIHTTLKAHSDICCMPHPAGHLNTIWNLYFSVVHCVMQLSLVVHGQSQ